MRTPILLSLLLAGCAAHAPPAPADRFLADLQALCGKAYAGRIVTDDAADANFAGKPLTMHVRECTASETRIPFHVGDDRSRTWVIARTAAGLTLSHDHRHADGSEDVLTRYGGTTVGPGTAGRQSFPADDGSKRLFVREGRQASVANVWTIELVPGDSFAYELTRPGRHFRVAFDLSRPVPAPPPPWGAR
jgi:hypothetical protein